MFYNEVCRFTCQLKVIVSEKSAVGVSYVLKNITENTTSINNAEDLNGITNIMEKLLIIDAKNSKVRNDELYSLILFVGSLEK